ncbi:Threonine synthase-like 2 [Chamberlinius hualienensis]
MLYHSTRSLEKLFTFEEVLTRGFAEDGGLTIPSEIPNISLDLLLKWRNYSYIEIVFQILKLYIGPEEIEHENLRDLIKTAFSKFACPEIIPFTKLRNGVIMAEMYHGPTLAFKDLAMVVVAQLLQYFLQKPTSGDTGGAAIASMAGLGNIDLIVMYPKDGCNELQQLQMNTVTHTNIHCYSVDGTSDEEDIVMTEIMMDIEFVKKHNLTVANSTNWARIAMQTAQYFYSYLQNVENVGDSVTFVVPSGGGGNLTSGSVAYLMGLPIKLVSTVNSNDVLHRFVQDNVVSASSTVTKTWASAMDIQLPLNLERLMFLFSRDAQLSQNTMQALHNKIPISIPESVMKQIKSLIVDSHVVDDNTITQTMRKCWEEDGYIPCPHTATALAYVYKNFQKISTGKVICLATASAIKFQEAVSAADIKQSDDLLQQLRKLPNRFKSLKKDDDWKSILSFDICQISKSRRF